MSITTMKEAREACAQRGITPARSLAETIMRIGAHDAEVARLNKIVQDGRAAETEDEKAGREERAAIRNQGADYSGIEARVMAHMAEDGSSVAGIMNAPYGKAQARAEGKARGAYQDEMRRMDALGEKRHMDEVLGLVPRALLVRARPRQAFGIVGDIMTPFVNIAPHAGPRPSGTYRASRRNAAKALRRSVRKAGSNLVPAHS